MVVVDRLAHRRRRARQLARRTFAPLRTIVVPLLGHDESEHALVLACRLAADANARVLLLAPLEVEAGLPLNARFDEEEQRLTEWLGRVRAYAESYGIRADTRLVRTRNFGLDVAEEAEREGSDLIVVGTPIRSRQGFNGAFPEVVERILRHADCRVLIATGDFVGANGRAAA
jgi:nucleotide-binding universal stress UspA family protein